MVSAKLRSLWRAIRHRSDVERQIRDEFESHLDAHTAHLMASDGLSHEHATRRARLEFGSRVKYTEESRESLGWRLVDEVRMDLRHAVRGLAKTPGFAAIAVCTLALGIGANTAIFSLIRTLLLTPLPYTDASRLVQLTEQWPNFSGGRPVSMLNYLDWADQNTVFERIAAVSWGDVTVGGVARPVQVYGSLVSPAYFDVFGLRAAIGRTFAPDEDQPGRERVVVLSHRLWVSQFAADPAVVGTPVRLDRQVYTIIGVMPRRTGLDFLDPQLWRPLTFEALPPRGSRPLRSAVAKLRQGVTLAQARGEMAMIGDRLARAYPDSNKGYGVSVQPYPRPIGLNVEPSLYLLFAAVAVVLLIACVNLANLALVRGTARAREVAIRRALGAGRARLIRHVLIEHVMIAGGGMLCGVVVASIILVSMRALIPTSGLRAAFPPDTAIVMDAPVWLFALALCVVCGIAFGVAPAIGATRVSVADVIKTEGGPGVTTSRPQRRFRQMLVIAQVASAFVLLTSATLLIHSLFTLTERIESGFDSTHVLTAGLPTAPTQFDSDRDLNAYLDEIARRIQGLPEIRDVAFADTPPTRGIPWGTRFQIVGQPTVAFIDRPSAGFKVVSPSYFRAVGLRLIAGRALAERDRDGAPFVVVINEALARTYFHGTDPVGQHLLMRRVPMQSGVSASGPGRRVATTGDLAWTIVGVIADEGVSPLDNRVAEPAVYATREQHPRSHPTLVVRTTGDPTRVQESLRNAVAAFDRDQALADLKTLDQLTAEDLAPDRLRSMLLSVFAAIAVALAAIGVYGVIAYSVLQRTREIGIRAALGASKASLLALVVRQGVIVVVVGVAAGVGAALAVTRLLDTFLYGAGPWDPKALVASAGVLTAATVGASYFPARRATKVEPIVALRCE